MTVGRSPVVVSAGSNYLDIDAYACCVALAELLRLQGEDAIAYSAAAANYSVCDFLTEDGQMVTVPPEEAASYIIVDVSDPEYIKDGAPLERVVAVYDHHVGFEDYWKSRIGDGARIEFIGAAATLIYREWKAAGLEKKMRPSTARLLIAAILDNTLNLTSSNTTPEDRAAFHELCRYASVEDSFRALYFSKVQERVEADLRNALFNDLKRIGENPVLPGSIAQLCVWDGEGLLARLSDIRQWLSCLEGGWMLNLIDLQHNCCYFVCDSVSHQNSLEGLFDVRFEDGIAKTKEPFLRKQILKRAVYKT